MIWPFNRKPQEPPAPPSAPPAPRFIGGECHLVVGDQVVALRDGEMRGGRIVLGAIYTVTHVGTGTLIEQPDVRVIGITLAEPETHWLGSNGRPGIWVHANFRKAAPVRDFEAFRTKLLAPVDLNERAKV